MLKYKTLLLGVSLCLGLTGPAVAQDASAETVVATVNGTDITLGNMIAMAAGLEDQQKNLPNDVLFAGVLERLIQQTAISQSSAELSTGIKLRLENERSALIASELVNQIAAEIDVSEADVQAAYDARFADFQPTTEYNASHILVATEDEAKAILQELNAGADFAALAKEKSTGPSGPGGGNLGWFGAGRMVPEFETAVVALEKGQLSDPVQTQFGWHVIKLDDTRIPEVPTLDAMRGDIQSEVWRTKLRDAVDEIVGAADVVRPDISALDPAVLRDLSLIGY